MPLNLAFLPTSALRTLCLCAGTLVGLITADVGMAQTVKTESLAQGSATKAKPSGAQPGPAWAALTPPQRQALAPLAATWDSLNPGQQRKWLEVSRNYPALPVADQAKMHGRMSEWVGLSARERSAARLNFAATTEIAKELSPQEKKAKWDAYQALSPEERRKLAEQASRRPAGAAPATRPVAPQKLATLPGTAAVPAKNSKLSADSKSNTSKPTAAAPADASTAAAPVERVER